MSIGQHVVPPQGGADSGDFNSSSVRDPSTSVAQETIRTGAGCAGWLRGSGVGLQSVNEGWQSVSVFWTRVAQGAGPLLLDAAEPPDRQRDHPGEDEQPDDGEADVVQVEAGRPRQRPGGDAELVGEDRDQLDGADDQRDRDARAR